MFTALVAACLMFPRTDIAPKHQVCSVLERQPYYGTMQECQAVLPGLTKSLKSKTLTVTDTMCLDRSKLAPSVPPVVPPETPPTNPVDPKLKPLTPDQQSKNYQSM